MKSGDYHYTKPSQDEHISSTKKSPIAKRFLSKIVEGLDAKLIENSGSSLPLEIQNTFLTTKSGRGGLVDRTGGERELIQNELLFTDDSAVQASNKLLSPPGAKQESPRGILAHLTSSQKRLYEQINMASQSHDNGASDTQKFVNESPSNC